MNRTKLEDLIDAVEDATRGIVDRNPGILTLTARIREDHRGADPAEHTLAAALAVSKSIANYVDAGCAQGTLQPYGAGAHAKIDDTAKVLRAALAAIDGLHREFPAEEKQRIDA
jgi:hypothetical protein